MPGGLGERYITGLKQKKSDKCMSSEHIIFMQNVSCESREMDINPRLYAESDILPLV